MKSPQPTDPLDREIRITRRRLARLLGGGAATLAAGSLPALAGSDPAASTFQALELNHLALRVVDPARSAAFYRRHLGMRPVLERPFASFLGCGPHFVALFGGATPGLDHFSVTVPAYDQAAAAARLRAAGLEPQLEENRTYFLDPDGLKIQLESATAWPGDGRRPPHPER